MSVARCPSATVSTSTTVPSEFRVRSGRMAWYAGDAYQVSARAVRELDDDQVPGPVAFERRRRRAVDEEPAAERRERRVDALEVRDDLGVHGDAAEVGDGEGGHGGVPEAAVGATGRRPGLGATRRRRGSAFARRPRCSRRR
jgi:hypothetical protein